MGRPQLVSREEIIAAARDVFVKEGLAASIRDVAAVAGISEAAIFKRFSTKAALIVAAMAPPRPDIGRLLAPLDGPDLQAALRATMQNIVGFFRDMLPVTLPVAMQPDVGLAAYIEEIGENPATELNTALAAPPPPTPPPPGGPASPLSSTQAGSGICSPSRSPVSSSPPRTASPCSRS